MSSSVVQLGNDPFPFGENGDSKDKSFGENESSKLVTLEISEAIVRFGQICRQLTDSALSKVLAMTQMRMRNLVSMAVLMTNVLNNKRRDQ